MLKEHAERVCRCHVLRGCVDDLSESPWCPPTPWQTPSTAAACACVFPIGQVAFVSLRLQRQTDGRIDRDIKRESDK